MAFDVSLESANREALAALGDGRVTDREIRYIASPRHIDILNGLLVAPLEASSRAQRGARSARESAMT
jgi:hypothetical protein